MTFREEQIGDCRLILGDCRDVLPTLGKVDAVVTDPPYGETGLEWDRRVPFWPRLVLPLMAEGASMWVFGSMRMFLETPEDYAGWALSQDVIWEKHNGSGLHNDRFRRVHELALHFYPQSSAWGSIYKAPQFTYDTVAKVVRKKGKPAHWRGATGGTTYVSEDGGPRLQRSVIYARSEHGHAEHPTQKPQAILDPLLLYNTPPHGVVLDPFMGSGSTGVAARRNGRGFIGVEGNQEYFDIACRRIEEAYKQPDMFIAAPEPKAVQPSMFDGDAV